MSGMDMEFTGERVVPGKTPNDIYREHIDRYIFAAGLAKDKTVLDVACGTGYGVNHIIENGAATAVGVDISLESATYARDKFGSDGKPNFVCADGTRMPFVDGTFDIVVSFETIEHIRQYREFLFECRRVLKENGLFICSTPNRRIFSPNAANPPNPFHVKEFWADEFRRFVCRCFVDVTMYGQCDVTLADNSVERYRGVHGFADGELVSSAYMIAVARKKVKSRS
jgi:ubiquinone/menaquinone biosynthesis C-methylase UbiE